MRFFSSRKRKNNHAFYANLPFRDSPGTDKGMFGQYFFSARRSQACGVQEKNTGGFLVHGGTGTLV